MEDNRWSLTRAEFQRRPGGRRGCGCCGFYFAGLATLPLLVIAAILIVL